MIATEKGAVSLTSFTFPVNGLKVGDVATASIQSSTAAAPAIVSVTAGTDEVVITVDAAYTGDIVFSIVVQSI